MPIAGSGSFGSIRSRCRDEDLGDGEVARPVVVGRDDMPGRRVGRGLLDRLLPGRCVLVPAAAIVQVAGPELPALLRVVEALLEPLALLVAGDVEKHLHDRRALVRQQPLEGSDVMEPGTPHRLRNEAPHPNCDDVLVLRAVEDRQLAPRRARRVYAPEEVVRELGGGRLAERDDAAALRVHPREDVSNRPVLPGRVHSLQHEQQRSLGLCDEAVVQEAQPRDELGKPRDPGRLVLGKRARIGRASCELRRRAGLDGELPDRIVGPHGQAPEDAEDMAR